MHIFTVLCYLLAFILFVLASFGVNSRVNLTSAGLACWVLVQLAGVFR